MNPTDFKTRVANAKRNADIMQVIESTGARPAHSNPAKGEYTYHAPYREDVDPSLKINVHLQKFIDYGMDGSEGDVIELTRRIFGKGNINAMPFLKAIEWLEGFSAGVVAPAAIQPVQRPGKQAREVSHEGDRYTFVKSAPISGKSHLNNINYIVEDRKISLKVASRYLEIVTYKDNAAPNGDALKGLRYGIGRQNDAGGYEVRAASSSSNFKTSLGQKDITTFNGEKNAAVGDIFEGQFDFLTRLEMSGLLKTDNPTVILNTGRLAARAAEVIRNRPEWQHVKNWRVWQHNDDEGERTTQVLIEGLGEGYSVGTLNHYWEGHNDLNECWTASPGQQITELKRSLGGMAPIVKFYDSSASSEHRRFQSHKPKI